MLRKKMLWIFIIALIAIEQGVKLIINRNCLGVSIPIISHWVYFEPMFNRDYSWFNSMLQLNISRWIHIFFVGVMVVFVYLLYKFAESCRKTDKITDTAFAFIFSGAVCSLIDKVLWNGSLDYIAINGLFTFDLKDVYINIFNAILILMVIYNYKGLRSLDEGKALKAFISFLRFR